MKREYSLLLLFFLMFSSCSNLNNGKREISSSSEPCCGDIGSLEERKRDCNFSEQSFALVHRTNQGEEIYLDSKNKLLWTEPLTIKKKVLDMADYQLKDSHVNYFQAKEVCKQNPVQELDKRYKWRLPTLSEVKRAKEQGLIAIESFQRKSKFNAITLGIMNKWFWTDQMSLKTFGSEAYIFSLDQDSNYHSMYRRNGNGHVMCVADI